MFMRVDQHVLSEVSDYNRWLLWIQAAVYAGMAACPVLVVPHHFLGNVSPVAALRYEWIAFDDRFRIARDYMTGAFGYAATASVIGRLK